MGKSDRRTFLKQSAAVVPAIALGPQAATLGSRTRAEAKPEAPAALNAELLGAVGGAVLPIGDLGAEGMSRTLRGFQAWLDEYEPVSELNHGYFSGEIRYTAPDPGPRWQAQLEALDAEARKRHDAGLIELGVADQQALLARHIGREGANGLPGPARANHVAVGLLAWFYATSEANDVCYRAAIRKQECRGLDGVDLLPDQHR